MLLLLLLLIIVSSSNSTHCLALHCTQQMCRTQLKNREDCLGRLEEALARAAIVPKTRNMRTGLTAWEKENRLKEKKKRADTKSARRQKNHFDE